MDNLTFKYQRKTEKNGLIITLYDSFRDCVAKLYTCRIFLQLSKFLTKKK